MGRVARVTGSPLTLLLGALAVATLLMIAAVDLAVVLGSSPSKPDAARSPLARDTALPTPSSSAVPMASTSTPAPSRSRSPSPSPSPVPSPSPSPSSSPAPSPVAVLAPAWPVPDALDIPAQGVIAPIDACRVVDRELLPPSDVQRTCYWTSGAGLAAAAGTTVLVGESDRLGAAPSALGGASTLRAGDELRTADGSGTVTDWRVIRVEVRAKRDGVDPAAFAGPSGPRRLYLVTAGGRYDGARHAYLDNVYVLAVPIS